MGKEMIGSGQYSRKTYNKAVKAGCAIKTSRGGSTNPRKMHRESLLKWVSDVNSVKDFTLTDPRNLIPYRGKSFGGAVEALMSRIKPSSINKMTATFNKEFSSVTGWSGEKNKEIKGNVAGSWTSGIRLFEIACKNDSQLKLRLANRKSGRKGDNTGQMAPVEKFIANIYTIQRVGGVTPGAMPLMSCQYCIDSRYVKVKGKPQIEFRLVIGRYIPEKSGLRDYNKKYAPAVSKACKAA